MNKTTISREIIAVALNLSKVAKVKMFVFPDGRVGLRLEGYSYLFFDKPIELDGDTGFVFNFSKLKKLFSVSKSCDIEITTEGSLLKKVTCSEKTAKRALIDFEPCHEFLPIFSQAETEGDEFLITEDFRKKVAHIESYRCRDGFETFLSLYLDFRTGKMFGTDGKRIEVVKQEGFPESWKNLSNMALHYDFAPILKTLPGVDFLLCFDDGVILKDVGNFSIFMPNREFMMPDYDKLFIDHVDKEDDYITIPSLRLYEKLLPYKKDLLKKKRKFPYPVFVGKTVGIMYPQFNIVCANDFNCDCNIRLDGAFIFTLLDEFKGNVEIKVHKTNPFRAVRFTSGDFYGLLMPLKEL